ncbi:head decoration protein [Mitsuokella sp.]|uniref:head decoration protein n=1 Tax=Mitsuokella sp. TaxID=2049034 RepID=UPI003D7E0DF4
MAYYTKETGTSYNHLLGGPEVEVLTKNVTLASGQKVTKGTLLTLADGKYSATAAAGKASAIASEDYDASSADKVVTVFIRGRFNRNAIVVASGDTVEAHEEELRELGIYLTAEKED